MLIFFTGSNAACAYDQVLDYIDISILYSRHRGKYCTMMVLFITFEGYFGREFFQMSRNILLLLLVETVALTFWSKYNKLSVPGKAKGSWMDSFLYFSYW